MEEEYWLDRAIEIGTGDEENEAQTYCCNASTEEDDDDCNPHSDNILHLDDCSHTWPQTYRYYTTIICIRFLHIYLHAYSL